MHLFLFSIYVASLASYAAEKQNKAKILNGYDISTRPAVGNHTVKVDFDMKIQKIVKFVSDHLNMLFWAYNLIINRMTKCMCIMSSSQYDVIFRLDNCFGFTCFIFQKSKTKTLV